MPIGSEEHSAGPSLEEFVGQEFGDFEVGTTDDPSTAAPAASADPTPAPTTDGAEPTADDAPPPTPADAATPDAPVPSDAAVADPLEGYAPFTYRVDGADKTFAGIKVHKDGGALIDDDAVLQDLGHRLGERDRLADANATLYRQTQDLEKLTEWKTKDTEGRETVLTGRQALEAIHSERVGSKAALDGMVSMFARNPTDFVGQNEKGEIVWNMAAIKELGRQARLDEREAQFAIKQQYAAPSSTPSTRAPDMATAGPAIITQTAQQLGVDAKTLSPESVALLTELVPQFIRPATAEDRRLNPALTIGEPVVDPRFTKLVEREVAQAKALATTAQTTAKTTATVTAQNAARLAAARTPKPAAVAPKAAPKPQARTAADADAGWDMMQDLAHSRLKAAG